MTQVKICGIRRLEDAQVAIDAGADMLGFVFAESRRRIEPEAAGEIIREVRPGSRTKMVGVFVNSSPEEMNRVAEICNLDYIQLSGDDPDDGIPELSRPAIRAIHMRGELTEDALRERASACGAEIILLDTAQAGAYGGTGRTFDWDRVPVLDRPILLAGGLCPENVQEAIRKAGPWGVDVSSGVETAGEKDHGKIRDFIRAARG